MRARSAKSVTYEPSCPDSSAFIIAPESTISSRAKLISFKPAFHSESTVWSIKFFVASIAGTCNVT